jgi:hypothetical protein
MQLQNKLQPVAEPPIWQGMAIAIPNLMQIQLHLYIFS